MNEDDRPTRHPAVETAVFGNEAVLYDERSGTVHRLNSSAYAIWALLDGRRTDDIIATLTQTTGLPPGEIRRDVLGALAELASAELLAD